MKLTLPLHLLAWLLFAALLGTSLASDAPKPEENPELAEFKTVEQAVTTKISRTPTGPAPRPGYLGVSVQVNDKGKLQVDEIEADSPAVKAGLVKGDLIVKFDGKEVDNAEVFRSLVLDKPAGESATLTVLREGKPVDLSVKLAAVSRPMPATGSSGGRAVLGIQLDEARAEGVRIRSVNSGGAAEKAGLKAGDIILKIDDKEINADNRINDILAARRPGDVVTVTFERDEKTDTVRAELQSDRPTRPGGGWDDRLPSAWRKDLYRLAVICVEYPDVKRNPKITLKDWEESLFSKGTYTGKNNATGQPVYGSMNDYYIEQSYGKLRIEGKVFDFVEMSKKRMEYSGGSNKTPFLTEAMDKLLEREGKDALKEFDGVFFLYAGGRPSVNRGDLYWPHRASFNHGGKRWPYFICPEGGERMQNISVFCHEFGHLLGLPDLYARPENPGSEGVGQWCAMSNQISNGRPQHFSAWCKEQLGWIQPAVIDPTVKQKLILSPINNDPKQCFKVLVKPDGSEYFLLENRKKTGFDRDLPAEGLLIWRVVQNKPILEESHGVEGPSGPRVHQPAVPFPSSANNAFTPFTTPSSRSQLGGGLPVYITNIRKLSDGRITFYIGYEFQ